MSSDNPQPREVRSSVIVRAVVKTATGKEAERRVRNLSPLGACLDHCGDLTPGDELQLDMGSLRNITAQVVWAREHVAGISFAEPVDLAAARRSRGQAVTVTSGWLAEIRDAYR